MNSSGSKIVALLLLSACCSFSQNFAVRLIGTNVDGIPVGWPIQTQPIGTNTSVQPPFLLMTASQIDGCKATNQTAYATWESNQVYQAKAQIDANLSALVTSYSNLQWVADHWDYVTNIANLRIAVQAEGQVLLRLKPVLQQLYNGQQ